jgi:hypothetical protein
MNTAVKTDGISIPPKKPCTTRAATRTSKLPESAQIQLAATKPSVALANRKRRDKARVRMPVSGIATTSAIR